MRYHKAVAITKVEADSIIATTRASATGVVVISHHEKWFDVRAMSLAEVEAFTADLARLDFAADRAKAALPN
jgi:molybdopterin-guanine dinucleotide biosynthesis protein